MKFRQIEAFRCLMVSGTSIGAARKMNITQPAISRLVSDLEDSLGFRLFNRSKGRLEPTTAGVRFYRAVEENFLGLERLSQVASNIRNETPEGISVACLFVLSTTLMPLVLKEFFKYHPDVPVTVDTCNGPEILVRLQDMKVDMAIALDFPPFAGIEIEKILKVNVMCAMPDGHRLTHKEIIYPSDLDGENMIGWVPIISQNYEKERKSLAAAGSVPRNVIKTHTSHTRYAMVASGLGLSIVEPFAAKIWKANGVVVRPFAGNISYEYVLAYPGGGIRSQLMHDFRDAVIKVAKEYDFGFDARSSTDGGIAVL
nr:LysR substrate-binding domain-containing protein [uncultured Undibacterium sp.]